MPDDFEGESGADRAYTWTVRALYTGLIVGNLLLVWETWKDTASGIEWRAKMGARVARLRSCSSCERRKAWLRDRAYMLWQAEEAVNETKTGGEQ